MTFRMPANIFRAAAGLLVLTSCTTGPIDDVACPNSTSFRHPIDLAQVRPAAALAPGGPSSYEDVIIRALKSRQERLTTLAVDATRQNIAVLSGGGQYGAYGAGFMHAWHQDAGTGTQFDQVTGISTGALQSTLVFLGEDADYEDLENAYRINDEEDLAIKRASLFGIPLTNSIYSLDPARGRIEKFVTPERMERVAAAARQGRVLMVGVVDARDGNFYGFDLTALAASDDIAAPIRRRCYIEVLMASAAVPAIFPPVYIDEHQYFDGGVRGAVFLDSTINALQKYALSNGAKVDLYLVFNGFLEIDATPKLDNSILATLKRTAEITLNQIEQFSVRNVLRLGDRHNARWTYIPSGACLNADQDDPRKDVFNASFMDCLIGQGKQAGAGGNPWHQP